ncbi:MAG: hypothetical protein O3A47_07630 [Chloroflexi bacterium]|nr:hypothetical protein [Chloroflexota bacterium]
MPRRRLPSHMLDLVDRVLDAAADVRYVERMEMYTRHNRLEKVGKAPVCVHLHAGYPVVWRELIPTDTLVSRDPLERWIELQLRQKLYKHDHIPDDEVLLPTVWLSPVRPTDQTGEKAGTDAGLGLFEQSLAAAGDEHAPRHDSRLAARLWGGRRPHPGLGRAGQRAGGRPAAGKSGHR